MWGAEWVALVAAAALASAAWGCGGSQEESTVTRSTREQRPPAKHADEAPRPVAPVPGELWGREFVGVSVEDEDAERPPLDRPRDLRVSFSKWKGGKGARAQQWIDWKANCNGYGSKLRIEADAFDLREVGSTLIGCPERPRQEDDWLWRFFESDPRWRLEGRDLVLSSDGAALRLREQEQGPAAAAAG